MTELLRVAMESEDGGGQLFVEIPDDEPGMVAASPVGDRVYEASRSLEESLEPIRRAARATLESFKAISPTSVELEFGVKLNASAGAVLTRAGVEGHFVVRLAWQADGVGPGTENGIGPGRGDGVGPGRGDGTGPGAGDESGA